jgi:hypothetical protein
MEASGKALLFAEIDRNNLVKFMLYVGPHALRHRTGVTDRPFRTQ